jgi:HSP20 family protein
MDKKKRHGRHPRDFWDDFFGESVDEFMNMRRNMDKIFRDAVSSFPNDEMKKKPFVYGFTVRMGPDGIPHIQQFGNTKLGKSVAKGEAPGTEREPLTDIIEAQDHIAITIELPGVEKEDINMEIFEDSISIDVDTEQRKYHKELPLPENLDTDSIKATCKNGVLDIVISRKSDKPKKGKKVSIT